MSTWNRNKLKEKAKVRLKGNYWKAVFVALIMMLIGASTGILSSAPVSGKNSSRPAATSELDKSVMSIDIDKGLTVQMGDTFSLMSDSTFTMFMVSFIVVFLIVFAIGLCIIAFFFNPLEVGCSRFFYKNLEENAEVKEVCYTFDRGYKKGVKIMFFRDLYTILWTLLFVIPGIVKSYEYRMIPYLLSENPDMSKDEAFARSKKMMFGNKWHTFVLDLSFIPWYFLGSMTLGLANILYVNPYKNLTDAGLYQALKDDDISHLKV